MHLGSVVGVALAFVHAYQMGTDAAGRAFRIGLLLLVAVGTYTLFIRLVGVVVQPRAAARTVDIHSWHTATLHLVRTCAGLNETHGITVPIGPTLQPGARVRPGGATAALRRVRAGDYGALGFEPRLAATLGT